MNRATTRLALRLHRFELLAFGGLIALAIALTLAVSAQMDASGFGAVCMAQGRIQAQSAACAAAEKAFDRAAFNPLVDMLRIVLIVLPLVLSALAGVAVVGRDLERGTARLAWSLAPSRARWFLGRMVPVLAVVVGLSLAAGLAADRLTASLNPGIDAGSAFVGFGYRGIDLAARGLLSFGIAVLLGAWMGRALPALLVAGVVIVVGLAGGEEVHHRILQREAVSIPGEWDPTSMTFASGFQAPDGRFVGWEEMQAIDPQPTDASVDWTPIYPPANLGVPGARYAVVSAREALALVLATGAVLAVAALVVRRARPG